jgi:RecA-family ATPase
MNSELLKRATEKVDKRLSPRAKPLIHDAASLLMTKAQPVRAIVPMWLYEGLGLLVANPKVGKSTLILQIAIAVSSGGTLWGQDVPRAKVLMIDLETNERRLRRKLEEAGATSVEPGWLMYATDWPRGMLGVQTIAETLDANPEIRLVVIDTLQRFRDASAGRQNAYAADYEALAPLQQLCRDRPGLAIVCVHHKRKTAGDDPIDSINGSAAIAGACDAIWIMSRKAGAFELHIQGRDWERDEDTFAIERADRGWHMVSGPRYSNNEAEVLKHLDITGGMSAPQLAEALQIGRQSAYERLTRMRDRGLVRWGNDKWTIA